MDLSILEGQIVSNILNSLAIPNDNDAMKTSEKQETNNHSSSKLSRSNERCQMGVGVAIEQISISIHGNQKYGSRNESNNGLTFYLVGDTVKSHVVLGDDGMQNCRFLTQNLTLYEGT